jgi:dipeptidyl aminopeptidase/acylaminoacyl peptidase
VRLSPTDTDQEPADLLSGGATFTAPGTLTRVNATASDGQTLHGWLALPEGASAGRPAPIVLWIHGGPLRSWNHWHPHSHPWILAAHGYAVLMADPALSTGYGQDYLRRGWGNWGGRPYADLMTLFDAIAEREDIDGAHAAAMGASFGGYMASWIAVNTTRFKAIVTHAGIWTLEHFACTSDIAPYWVRELGDPLLQRSRYEANSPHLRVAGVSTPILISHGGMDHRVPVGESLRLWHDLCRHGLDGKFLFFPDEGHCILQPGNVKVWYETILAFLDHHLLGKDWDPPLIIGESQCRERSYDGSH